MALNFSDSDKQKYMTGQYRKEIKLYFPQLSLTVLNGEIYGESLSLEEAIFDGNGELSIVGCISNRFSIEIRNQGVQLKNKTIQVSIRIDNGSWNQIFTGYVDSVETVRDRSYQKLQCYDALYKYQDKNFFNTYAALNFPVTIKTLRDSLFGFIGVTQETITLVNDDITVEQTVEDGELAVIDVIRAICQINGVFGRICADGKFHYVDLEIPSEFLPFPADDNYPGSTNYPSEPITETQYIDKYKSISYEDYTLEQISGVTVRDSTSDTEYGSAGTSGNVLLIEGNMLANGLEQITKETIASNILDKVKYAVYQPFSASSVGLPFVECGDAVAYYVYDYSTGTPQTEIMGFTVMKRSLIGIQWMTDTYDASGTEYQPEVQPVSGDAMSEDISNIKNDISSINDRVNQQSTEISGKQNFIDLDILPPTGSGRNGDLVFHGVEGSGAKELYRYEDSQWVKINLGGAEVTFGDTQPQNAKDGDVFFLVDSLNVIGISFRLGGAWHDFGIYGGSATPTVRMRQVLDTGLPQTVSVSIRNSTS